MGTVNSINPRYLTLHFLFAFLILFSSSPVTFSQPNRLSSRSEFLALYQLRSSLGLRARDWPRGEDPCLAWRGVSCQNRRVTGLDISGFKRTRLGRMMPQFSVEGLKELSHLTRFNASGFFLPGSIPDWFGTLNPGFSVMDLSGSGITGQIPKSIGNLSKLSFLDLSLNRLHGPIPVSLGNLTDIKTLNLSHNGLSGSIPDEFWSLRSLEKLDLSGNGLIGELPSPSPSIGSSSTVVILSNNFFYGKISLNFTNSFLSLGSVDISGNYFDGAAPIGSQSRGGSISISENCFLKASDQRLPAECISFYSARGAAYDGPPISPADHLLVKKSRTKMYVLIGAIGGVAILLVLAALLTVLYCTFCRSGRRRSSNPVLPRHQNQNSSSRRSNPVLPRHQNQINQNSIRRSNPEPEIEPEPEPEVELSNSSLSSIESRVNFRGGDISTGDGPRLSDTRPSNNPAIENSEAQMADVKILKDFSKVRASYTYGRLRRATSDFSEANLIHRGHSGDLYRGILDDGTRVACKRMHPNLANKDDYVDAELELFAKGIHKRLVFMLGKCLDAPKGVKVLVYRFVENGDLRTVLHRKSCEKKKKKKQRKEVQSKGKEVVQSRQEEVEEKEEIKSIDWITRLKIAIGVAESLCYLHYECEPPLVHRDVRARSILLDDNFEVRLCSLSDVQQVEDDDNNNNGTGAITRLLKPGSSSEPGSSTRPQPPATLANDVYSFGLVLLELITGLCPPATPSAWLAYLLPSIDLYKRDAVKNIIDPLLFLEEDHVEEAWGVAVLAKSCLHAIPSERPSMKHILKALENPLMTVREDSLQGGKVCTRSGRWDKDCFEGMLRGKLGSGSGGSNRSCRSFSFWRGSEVAPEVEE